MGPFATLAANVFFGRLTPQMAHIYVRLPRFPPLSNASITGRVQGPFCELHQTLTTTVKLRDLGQGPTILGQAKMPDPCFWSPKLPAIYQVTWEVSCDGQVIATGEKRLGLRLLVRRGRDLFWEGKRYVLRGVRSESAVEADLRNWRDLNTAMMVTSPPAELCEQASRIGVLLIVHTLNKNNSLDPGPELSRLAQWPAVGAVVLDVKSINQATREVAPNVLMGRMISNEDTVDDEPDFLIWPYDASAVEVASGIRALVPLVALRPVTVPSALTDARARCDELQRALAPLADFAGYIV